jgi:cellulose synthase/poly-beta-1,6-N-acetylglucosamine synthase-like glycosyltransferase
VDLMLAAAAIPAATSGAYLARLSLAARHLTAPPAAQSVTFAVVVPAHNEENGIAATVRSLLALDYPGDRFTVVVVADNCSDRTADVAREAGATVIVRQDPANRGKGYALARAYETILAEGWAQAVVVVDADTVVSPNLLSAFAARVERGAECLQAEYAVRNTGDSWRTRLMAIAFALYHTTRSLGRERLGLSCGLRGNGMGFTADVLRRVPHRAFSVVEDVEYGIDLGLAGVRVWYVPEATVRGEMPATAEASRSQRQRWEKGRSQLVRQRSWQLARAAWSVRGRLALDLLADLLVPPLTSLVAMVVIGCALATAGLATRASGVVGAAGWVVATLGIGTYVVRGCALSGVGPRAALDLLYAPVYATWKLSLMLRPSASGRGEWIRTRRANDNASV